MRKYGGAAIPMQSVFDNLNITYAIGSRDILAGLKLQEEWEPFEARLAGFLECWSKRIFKHPDARQYPDAITFAFWIRKSNIRQLKARFFSDAAACVKGRGVVFHIAPSNVAVNYAYSLAAGLMTGNANVLRIPSKEFAQVHILNAALSGALEDCPYMKGRVCLLRYGHEKAVNDALSAICDVRVVWGGDATIAQIRRSPLPARAYDICFADRYSVAVIDLGHLAQASEEERTALARDFYNDTYLTDQNACTSPRLVVWLRRPSGQILADAASKLQDAFWGKVWDTVQKTYRPKPVQLIDKLTALGKAAAGGGGCMPRLSHTGYDFRLMRVNLKKLHPDMMDNCGNSGFFYEYLTHDIRELACICMEKCQTVGYFGKPDMMQELIRQNIRGIDRAVPVGKTMDFDLLWDGYNLFEMFTRKIAIR